MVWWKWKILGILWMELTDGFLITGLIVLYGINSFQGVMMASESSLFHSDHSQFELEQWDVLLLWLS